MIQVHGSQQYPISLMRKEVIEVFQAVLDCPEHHFFGLTGDIDDLGIFVAHHGRAHAENLVDYVSAITEHYFQNWKLHNLASLSSFAFLQGGEEMLLLGTCASDLPLRELFSESRTNVDRLLGESEFFPVDNISISFGCAIFQRNDFVHRITRLLAGYNNIAVDCRAYLEIMYLLRRTLSVCLDLEKFRMFENLHPEIAIACRNLVHYDLLRHKDRSRGLVELAAQSLQTPQCSQILKQISDDYGIVSSRMIATASFVESLES